MSSGLSSAGELIEIFSAPLDKFGARVLDRADSAGDAERDVELTRHALYPIPAHGAALGGGGNVVEHDLVGTFVPVTARQVEYVADFFVVSKPNTFHDHAVTNVEARDDTLS